MRALVIVGLLVVGCAGCKVYRGDPFPWNLFMEVEPKEFYYLSACLKQYDTCENTLTGTRYILCRKSKVVVTEEKVCPEDLK